MYSKSYMWSVNNVTMLGVNNVEPKNSFYSTIRLQTWATFAWTKQRGLWTFGLSDLFTSLWTSSHHSKNTVAKRVFRVSNGLTMFHHLLAVFIHILSLYDVCLALILHYKFYGVMDVQCTLNLKLTLQNYHHSAQNCTAQNLQFVMAFMTFILHLFWHSWTRHCFHADVRCAVHPLRCCDIVRTFVSLNPDVVDTDKLRAAAADH